MTRISVGSSTVSTTSIASSERLLSLSDVMSRLMEGKRSPSTPTITFTRMTATMKMAVSAVLMVPCLNFSLPSSSRRLLCGLAFFLSFFLSFFASAPAGSAWAVSGSCTAGSSCCAAASGASFVSGVSSACAAFFFSFSFIIAPSL